MDATRNPHAGLGKGMEMKMNMTPTTPTPWFLTGDMSQGSLDIEAMYGPIKVRLASAYNEPDGELIVRAVNSYADLVEALRLAEIEIQRNIRDGLHLTGMSAQEISDLVDCNPTIIKMRAARSKAIGD